MSLDLNTNLPSSGYEMTYAVDIEDRRGERIVTIIFNSEDHSEKSQMYQYDDCREKIVLWLEKHFPGEILASRGDDIERSGHPADNDDAIDMRVPEDKNERIGREVDQIKDDLIDVLDNLEEIDNYFIDANDNMLFLTVILKNRNRYWFWWNGDSLQEEGRNDGTWDYMNLGFIDIASRLNKKYQEWS